ncbi:MAG: DUF2252 family protein, partial [Elusimicrobia bacterium]|nr:DUF2252 family protein [Elusimicrobiota bacterium]
MGELAARRPGKDELSVDAYVAAGGKWVKQMRANPLPKDDPKVKALLESYAKSLPEEGFLDQYEAVEAGQGQGSMGFRDLVLVLLRPEGEPAGRDSILLNIKAMRSDPDTAVFKNPYPDDAQRMMRAQELYAPGWEPNVGTAELDGVEYYVRGIPPQNEKLKKPLKRDELEDLAYAVGTQLGRGHRLSVQGDPQRILEDLSAHLDDYAAAGLTMKEEIESAYRRYMRALKALDEAKS